MKKMNIILVCLSVILSAFNILNDGYELGDVVDNFTLKNVDGKMVSLDDYKDKKGVIVVFTCNTCPYAKMYEERIKDLSEKAKQYNFSLIAINPNDIKKKPKDSFNEMKKRAKKKGYNFPYLRDKDQTIAKVFGAKKTPHVFILKRNKMEFTLLYKGGIDDNPQSEKDVKDKFVEKAIAEIAKGQEVTKASTTAIGCTIKWK